MNQAARRDDGAVFELTVEGELGPVLRHALQARAAEMVASTTIRATASVDSDVADLVGALDADGLTIESVRVSGMSAGERKRPEEMPDDGRRTP